jgi:hypothetical protein
MMDGGKGDAKLLSASVGGDEYINKPKAMLTYPHSTRKAKRDHSGAHER